MKILSVAFLLFTSSLLPFQLFASLDIGDGSDGACNLSGTITSATFNCTTLTIAAPLIINSGTSPLILKVQGAVNISSSITLTPVNGNNSVGGSASTIAGAIAIMNGANGGKYNGGTFLGEAGEETQTGCGGGAGIGDDTGGTKGSGGGAGGSHGTTGAAGIAGTDGVGGLAGNINTVNLSTSLVGGSGGGASGKAISGFVSEAGASGGAGGGAIRITSGSLLNITAGGSITANGGAGGNGNSQSGGGGGGSAGSINLQSENLITVAGSLTLTGGSGGTGAGGGGNGGSGGVGRIRFDTINGSADVDTTGATITAGVVLEYGTVTRTDISSIVQFNGDITSGCATIDTENHPPSINGGLGSIAIGFLSLLLLLYSLKALKKFQAVK